MNLLSVFSICARCYALRVCLHNQYGTCVTTPTRSVIRHAIFSPIRSPERVHAWPHNLLSVMEDERKFDPKKVKNSKSNQKLKSNEKK